MKLRVVMTNGVNYLIESGEFKDKDLMSALLKFHSDDWGILCNEDKEFQNELLKILIQNMKIDLWESI